MFVTPRYGDGALADLVPSVLGVLGVAGESDRIGLGLDGVRRVAILLIDGMGADLVAARRDVAPYLGGLPEQTLTAGFPSTTVTSLASLGTGVPAGEHGLVGYLLAVPDHERLMNPLKWRLMGQGPKVDLMKEVVPEQFQPVATAFERAAPTGHGDAVGRRPLERGRDGLELFGHHFLEQVDLGPLAHEPPFERIHQPLVVRDSEQVADEAVLARRYARAERGQARHGGARKARGQRLLRQAAEVGRDVSAGRNEIGAHAVDQQDRDPTHAVEAEADPVGLPCDAEHAEHGGNQVGEGAVAVARGDEHSARVSSAPLVRRQFVGGEEHSGKPK